MTILTEKLREQEKLYSEKKKKIEYNHVHTSGYEPLFRGAFDYSGGQISVFTSDIGSQNQSDIELMATLAHEYGHKENADVYHMEMSSEQIYKVNQCDEVGGKMRELLVRRNEYLKTGDISVFNDLNNDFSYYSEAVANGEIDPFKSVGDRNSFDKEMSFIMNRTMEEWQKKYGQAYDEQSTAIAKEYFCRVGKYAQHNDTNYNKALTQILNIGGVDFNRYRTQDFHCNSEKVCELGSIVRQGDEMQIAAARQKLIDEGISVVPSLRATSKQMKNGYLTRHNPHSFSPLKKSSEEVLVTKEEKIKNLTNAGFLDGTEDAGYLEAIGCDKDTLIKNEQTPEKQKIPDLSDKNFIVKPQKITQTSSEKTETSKTESTRQSIRQKIQNLRGFGKNNSDFGNGAGKIMQRQFSPMAMPVYFRE